MEVLVTGSEGFVGRVVCTALLSHGHSVVGFDVANSGDILEPGALSEAARSCDVIIHGPALLGFPGQTPDQIMAVNLQGTWNVLSAALDEDEISRRRAYAVWRLEQQAFTLYSCHQTTLPLQAAPVSIYAKSCILKSNGAAAANSKSIPTDHCLATMLPNNY